MNRWSKVGVSLRVEAHLAPRLDVYLRRHRGHDVMVAGLDHPGGVLLDEAAKDELTAVDPVVQLDFLDYCNSCHLCSHQEAVLIPILQDPYLLCHLLEPAATHVAFDDRSSCPSRGNPDTAEDHLLAQVVD